MKPSVGAMYVHRSGSVLFSGWTSFVSARSSNYSKNKVNREKFTEEKIERKIEKPVTQRTCIIKKYYNHCFTL